MKLFIDESLSPRLSRWLNETGAHEAFHPLDIGRRGEPDHRVLRRCIDENRILVTQNAHDFRRLVGTVPTHPGLIILPALDREGTWDCLQRAHGYLAKRRDPAGSVRNHVLEVRSSGAISIAPLRSLKTAVPSAVYTLFERAMRRQQPVKCCYDGKMRGLCPIVLGHSGGKEKALTFQFTGESTSRLPPSGEWRCLFLDKVSDVELQNGPWRSGDSHTQPQACVEIVDLDVNPSSPYRPRRRL